MPLILPARTLDTASYEISNSLRFNDGDSPYLNKTPSSASNRRTFTISLWAKRSDLDVSAVLYGAGSAATDMFQLLMQNTGQILIQNRVSGTNNLNFATSALFRDPSAWYHIVLAIDTTQGTDSNRAKLYVNGTQITDFSNETYPSQNYDCHINNTVAHHIAAQSRGSANDHFDGYIAELYSIDGSQKAPTDFGEFNNNGVWIPKEYSGTYGTNGFFMEFKQSGTGTDASGMGADTSGNTNHFAVNNLTATDITVDSPTNNFATLNPLSSQNSNLSEGNVEGVRTTSGAVDVVSTIAPSNGKWYFEFKNTAAQNSAIGVVNLDDWASGTNIHDYDYAAAVLIESNANYNVTYGNTGASSTTTLQNSTDLITAKYGLAVDIDNNDLYVSANGNWYGGSSFNQSDFSNATAVTTDLPSSVPLAFFARGSLANTFYVNFGNPGGDDSISSGNVDANGYGNFEYAVPTGFYSLCTKNLAEYG